MISGSCDLVLHPFVVCLIPGVWYVSLSVFVCCADIYQVYVVLAMAMSIVLTINSNTQTLT